MTWRELFGYAWAVLRSLLVRQHMCPTCGDAMTRGDAQVAGWFWGHRRVTTWTCEPCDATSAAKVAAQRAAFAATHTRLTVAWEDVDRLNVERDAELFTVDNNSGRLGGYGYHAFRDVADALYPNGYRLNPERTVTCTPLELLDVMKAVRSEDIAKMKRDGLLA